MRCRDARKQLGIYSYSAFDRQQLPKALQAHLDSCPECRHWLERIRATSDMVRGLPARELSSDFTARVLSGLQPHPTGLGKRLLDGLFGPLRAPMPLLPATQALAVAFLVLALLAGGGLYAAHNGRAPDLDVGGAVILADGADGSPAAMPVVVGPRQLRPVTGRSADALALDDLIMRHENYEMNKPLATDPGIRLVRDTGY